MNTGPLTVPECDVLAYLLDRLLANTPPDLRGPIAETRGLALAARTLAVDDSFSRKVSTLRAVP